MEEPKEGSLATHFLEYFSLKIATTEAARSRAYAIRYRVYCEEFGYENPDEFPDRQEKDEYDDRSLHCVIEHRSGMPAGCVRLVPTAGDIRTDPLPFEKYCGASVDQELVASLNLERPRVCEISRLAVDGAFRRRSGEAKTRFGEIDSMDISRQEERTFSLIAVAGFLAATALTKLSGRTQVFAMMEPFLPRLMKRSGIKFERAGKDIDYHGTRAPYFIRTEAALEHMGDDLKELYGLIERRVAPQIVAETGGIDAPLERVSGTSPK